MQASTQEAVRIRAFAIQCRLETGKPRRRLACGALLALILVVVGPAVAFGRSTPRAAALTAAINRVMREASIPGAVVGVWQPGRSPYVKAFGVRDTTTGQPMSTNLYFRIASVTKSFTVTAVLQLVDKGEVGLDSPISTYLSGVPDGNRITIRELAEMRSGLPNYATSDAFLRAWVEDPWRQWAPRQLLKFSFSRPLVFEPGTSYQYSNTNTVLLGLVVQKLSHQPLATYVKRQILEPLHLTHSDFPTGAEFPSPHPQGYTNFPKCVLSAGRDCATIVTATDWNPSAGWAAGAMISTLGDLHRWARDVATGKLLTPATQKQRLRFIAPPGRTGFGYGLGLENTNGWIGHDGDIPGYEALAIYLPSQKATVVVLINTGADIRVAPQDQLGEAITRIITPKHVY